MAGWQEELAELLRELGVTQEEPQTNLRSTGKPMRKDARWRLHTRKQHEHLADAFLSDDADSDEADMLQMDLGTMGREVDSIVRQVVQLMQHGELDRSAKEDILEVLHALRRFSAVAQQVAPGDEAYLESVSAMLRFCRLVLRLSETAIEDF
jgi:hypothetical protein